jgi:hypothetical protein
MLRIEHLRSSERKKERKQEYTDQSGYVRLGHFGQLFVCNLETGRKEQNQTKKKKKKNKKKKNEKKKKNTLKCTTTPPACGRSASYQ